MCLILWCILFYCSESDNVFEDIDVGVRLGIGRRNLENKTVSLDGQVDITFDVRSDSGGKDPDYASKTLRNYHKLLWSKNLPNGKTFNLDDTVGNIYLYHKSDLGEFYLASDSVIHTYLSPCPTDPAGKRHSF
jgi:hypothetical protein